MPWLIVALLSYFLFAVVFLVDKYLLVNSIQNPKVYTFYTSFLRVSVVLLIPFIKFKNLDISQIFLGFIAGSSFVLGLFWFFKALKLFDASKIVSAVGGFTPLIVFFIILIFYSGREIPGFKHIIALILLIGGSILINYSGFKKDFLQSLKTAFVSAFFFALFLFFSKQVYLKQGFLQGYILIILGGFLFSLFFLFFREVRNNLFNLKIKFYKNSFFILILNQITGATANFFQSWAIALAPSAYIPIVSALQGTQYMFLFLIIVFLSLKFPYILKEEITKVSLLQKIISIFLISIGLILLSIK